MPLYKGVRSASPAQKKKYDQIKESRQDVPRSTAKRIAAGVINRERAAEKGAGASSGRFKTSKNRSASPRSGARGRSSKQVRSTKRHS